MLFAFWASIYVAIVWYGMVCFIDWAREINLPPKFINTVAMIVPPIAILFLFLIANTISSLIGE